MHSTGLIAVLLLALVGNGYGCLSNPGQLPCDFNPCLNGATCTNVDVTSYTCSCTDSYEGNNCETLKASPCSSSPCLNGGTCSVVADFYFCTCEAAKYAGYNCELTVSPCTSGPCQNGGTCNQVGDTFDYTCDCPNGYGGDACQSTVVFTTSTTTIRDDPDTTTTTTTTTPQPTTTTRATTAAPGTSTTTAAKSTTARTVTTTASKSTTASTTARTTPQCPNNQEYNFCASPCQKTCSNPDFAFCIHMCEQRCDCPHEFPILDEATGLCVTLETCPVQTTAITPEETTAEDTTVMSSTIQDLPCDINPCRNEGSCIPDPLDTVYGLYCLCAPQFEGTFCENAVTTTMAGPVSTTVMPSTTTIEGSSDVEETTFEMPATTVEDTTTAAEITTAALEESTAEMTTSTTVPTTTTTTTTASTTVPPTTTVSVCASSPCENGGVCNEVFFNFGTTFLSYYTCTCADRYEGSNCETFVPACDSSPCQNGGSCSDVDGGLTYECTCTVRYEGTECETLILPCEPNPCQNGGTCTDNLDATYTCSCNEGYLGNNCETDITCSGNLAECLPIMSDFSRDYQDAKAYCEANGWHLAYIEDSSKYNLMINWVRTFWQTEFAGFDIDTRNHWVGLEYLGERQASNLGGDTTPYTITNWYPLGYPTSLDSFPDNDRMVMLVSITDESSFFQGMRNIDPYSTYYAVCQDPAYISTL